MASPHRAAQHRGLRSLWSTSAWVPRPTRSHATARLLREVAARLEAKTALLATKAEPPASRASRRSWAKIKGCIFIQYTTAARESSNFHTVWLVLAFPFGYPAGCGTSLPTPGVAPTNRPDQPWRNAAHRRARDCNQCAPTYQSVANHSAFHGGAENCVTVVELEECAGSAFAALVNWQWSQGVFT